MAETGITVKPGDGMTRIQATCNHQSGLIYMVPAERNWVCSNELLSAHALAGFFRELTALEDSQVRELMRHVGYLLPAITTGCRAADHARRHRRPLRQDEINDYPVADVGSSPHASHQHM